MKLRSIQIEEYKSIKQPIRILLNEEDRLITLIGKNGSGKTNVLQALWKMVNESSRNEQGRYLTKGKSVLQIEDAEKKIYFPYLDLQTNQDEIEVEFLWQEPTIKMKEVPVFELSAEYYKEKLEGILAGVTKVGERYLDTLKKIDEELRGSYEVEVTVKSEYGDYSANAVRDIQKIESHIREAREKLNGYIQENFSRKKLRADDYNDRYGYYPFSEYLPSLKMERGVKISKIIANILEEKGVSVKEVEEDYAKKIDEINGRLKEECDAIQKYWTEFQQIKKEIGDIFRREEERLYDKREETEKHRERFCTLVKKAALKTAYYIDNENSLLFHDREYDYGADREGGRYLNYRNPINEAIDGFLKRKGYYKKSESLREYKKISAERLRYLEEKINGEFLSGLLPNFDKSEINGYRISLNEQGIKLFVKEKSGEEIAFNSTSLGRRWQLTYSFVKSIIKSGEFLFIDEPAAFLHPEAQKEFRRDLEELAKSGIWVVITTHSPYMIPASWKNVYNVSMTGKGTHVQGFGEKDELCELIKEELGIFRTSDILFRLSQTILFVEGYRDKVCVEKFAEICGYDLSDYDIMSCNGSNIIALTYLCIKESVKFKALLDADNIDKPEQWLKNAVGYKEYLEIIKTNKNCVFTPEEGEKKSLEDCFSEQDKKKYFSTVKNKDKEEKKIDHKKVEKGELFTEKTLRNFEQLFIKLGIPKLDKQS